jgi:putative ABC transport system permease protein
LRKRGSSSTTSSVSQPFAAQQGTTASSGVSSVQYLLGDPTQIDAFRTAAQAVNLNWDWYRLDANDSRYEQMVAPIENVAASSNIVVIVTAVAGAAILALLLLLSLRDRTREIGVLLSLGEKKSALAGQMVIEALMLIVVAFVFGSLIGGGIAGRIGNSLLAREVTTSQTLAQQGAAGQVMLMGGRGQQSLRGVTPISTINVKAGLTELMQAGGVVLATVFAAVLLPVANLLRLKPRQILIRHE